MGEKTDPEPEICAPARPAPVFSGASASGVAMFGVLLSSYVINAMDRQLFPLLATDVRREYGFSLAGTGLLSTIFTLGLAVAGIPTGFLLARLSRKTVLQVGIGIFSAGTILTVLSAGFADMLAYRAATGIGEAMQFTVLLAIAANYFSAGRAAAIGWINFCFALGSVISPALGGFARDAYQSWRVPMLLFGCLGLLAIVVVALTVKPWFSEMQSSANGPAALGGAATVFNRNTVLLTLMSLIGGLVIYGYLGMYPTFLREGLHYSSTVAGTVMSAFGIGAMGSLVGGWLGDRFSPRLLLGASFLCSGVLGYLLFRGSESVAVQVTLSFAWGFVASGTIHVNLAGYHVKAVRSGLASRAAGIFVTSLYGSAAAAGYLMGFIAAHGGWVRAGELQLLLLSLVGGVLALALRPDQMAL
ncbi:MAG TPA: MFS transporter [Bryobacteraceae bacterium]|nr:MFS transporter [Bryobacteraceae bacterium]